MLDVHPPHEPIHTWKEYLLHMSTIVLGLLIAIGLEQSVEAVHRAHERADLRESLRRDSEKALADAERAAHGEVAPLIWLDLRLQLVKTALDTHRALPSQLPRKPHVSSDLPIDPAWGSAKSSGLLSLLSQQEVQVYSEADLAFTRTQLAQQDGFAASYKRAEFEIRYSDPANPGMINISHLQPAQLETYYALLTDEYGIWDQFLVGCEHIRGIETAILTGERDLGKIQQAERRFEKDRLTESAPEDGKNAPAQ
jgi:hypothetical protein